MSMKPTVGVIPNMTDEQLSFIREMGIEYVELNTKEEESTPESLKAIADRFSGFGLTICIISCMTLQKNDVIDLNLTEKNGQSVSRDTEIEKFNRLVRAAASIGVHTVSVAWQPTGIKRTAMAAGQHTRGGVAMICDMDEVLSKPNDYDRVYSEEEVWDNFAYFLKAITPT